MKFRLPRPWRIVLLWTRNKDHQHRTHSPKHRRSLREHSNKPGLPSSGSLVHRRSNTKPAYYEYRELEGCNAGSDPLDYTFCEMSLSSDTSSSSVKRFLEGANEAMGMLHHDHRGEYAPSILSCVQRDDAIRRPQERRQPADYTDRLNSHRQYKKSSATPETKAEPDMSVLEESLYYDYNSPTVLEPTSTHVAYKSPFLIEYRERHYSKKTCDARHLPNTDDYGMSILEGGIDGSFASGIIENMSMIRRQASF